MWRAQVVTASSGLTFHKKYSETTGLCMARGCRDLTVCRRKYAGYAETSTVPCCRPVVLVCFWDDERTRLVGHLHIAPGDSYCVRPKRHPRNADIISLRYSVLSRCVFRSAQHKTNAHNYPPRCPSSTPPPVHPRQVLRSLHQKNDIRNTPSNVFFRSTQFQKLRTIISSKPNCVPPLYI